MPSKFLMQLCVLQAMSGIGGDGDSGGDGGGETGGSSVFGYDGDYHHADAVVLGADVLHRRKKAALKRKIKESKQKELLFVFAFIGL